MTGVKRMLTFALNLTIKFLIDVYKRQVLWVTGSVCASPADEEGANKANNNLSLIHI